MIEAEALREEIRRLVKGRQLGDVPERGFERALAAKTLDLYRAVIRSRLAKDESVRLEHHVVHSHLRLSQSVLREPEQRAVSLFLTPRRLLRLRSRILAGRPVSCDEDDGTAIDELALESFAHVRVHREVRWGEAAAGVVIGAVGWLGRAWLAATGPLLVVLGVAGIAHALLLPTRWAEVETHGEPAAEPWCVHALGRKSGRTLVRALRAHLVAAVQ
jgi:hypothetical protein